MWLVSLIGPAVAESTDKTNCGKLLIGPVVAGSTNGTSTAGSTKGLALAQFAKWPSPG